ncbi:MAG TPA: hypothetical protein VE863_08665 [Pyrinomonadaceae bacterium]|nr:hypothetical protein [Pyrinomonadaceae bacterium]
MFRVLLAVVFLTPVLAQEGAAERATRLRAQLVDMQAQQSDLQTRLAQIDEDIKPENIERSLAGVGSTRPEDLREARRRQLEIQRKGLQTQLDTLTASRARLESAIATADAESYRQTVGPNASSNSTSKVVRYSHRQKHRLKR